MLFLSKLFSNFARQQVKKNKNILNQPIQSVFSWSGCDRTDQLPLRRRKRWELQKGLVMGAAVVVVWTGHSLGKRSAKSDTRGLYTLDAFFFLFFRVNNFKLMITPKYLHTECWISRCKKTTHFFFGICDLHQSITIIVRQVSQEQDQEQWLRRALSQCLLAPSGVWQTRCKQQQFWDNIQYVRA